MNCHKEDMLLYAITDRQWLDGEKLSDKVEEAIKGGATFIQYREKYLEGEAYIKEARQVQAVCQRYNVPFVINDNVEVARKLDADGVHVGQSDMAAVKARMILGAEKIIGVTAKTVEQAQAAKEQGADYLGVGAVFHSDSKSNALGITHEHFNSICEAVDLPIVAIGGISRDNVSEISDLKMDGIAVISAIFGQPNVEAAAREMRELAAQVVG